MSLSMHHEKMSLVRATSHGDLTPPSLFRWATTVMLSDLIKMDLPLASSEMTSGQTILLEAVAH